MKRKMMILRMPKGFFKKRLIKLEKKPENVKKCPECSAVMKKSWYENEVVSKLSGEVICKTFVSNDTWRCECGYHEDQRWGLNFCTMICIKYGYGCKLYSSKFKLHPTISRTVWKDKEDI